MIGVVSNIQRFSTNDGPGIRTTVFLKGCRLGCQWCHNPEGRRHYPEVLHFWPFCSSCGKCDDVCPVGALTVVEEFEIPEEERRYVSPYFGSGGSNEVRAEGKWARKIRIDKARCIGCRQCVDICPHGAFLVVGELVTVGEVCKEVESDKLFYDTSGGGMTLSGGEPTAQPQFAYSLLKAVKERQIHTALDTSGYQSWEILEKILDFTDLVLYDIKCMDSEEHRRFTGVPNELILDNARRIAEKGIEMRIRVPVIPGRNDSEENMVRTAEFAKSLGTKGVDLLPLHPWAGQSYRLLGLDYPFTLGVGYSKEKLTKIRQIFESYQFEVTAEMPWVE